MSQESRAIDLGGAHRTSFIIKTFLRTVFRVKDISVPVYFQCSYCIYFPVSSAVSFPNYLLITYSDIASSAEIPADKIIPPLSTHRSSGRIVVLGVAARIPTTAFQRVIADSPSNDPALPNNKEPVQTDKNISAVLFFARNQSSKGALFISLRLPNGVLSG